MFHCPCTIALSGVSGSGKTHLTYKIIEDKDFLFNEKITKVLYAYSVWQPFYMKMEQDLKINFLEGLPTIEYLNNFTDGQTNTILVLDDMMESVVKSSEIENIFTKLSHHKKINLIYITQNIYCQGKHSPCQKRRGLRTAQTEANDQCLLRISTGFSFPETW